MSSRVMSSSVMSGYEALETGAAWLNLSARGKIAVRGEDRARLVHAMSTNDVAHLAAMEGLYAFFLTAQGRIVADAYIYNLGDRLLLDTEPEIGGKLMAHLDKYIIADDAELADETDDWAAIGLEGPESAARAAALGIPIPEKKYGVAAWQEGFVARTAVSGADGFRIFVPRDRLADFERQLERAGVPQASMEEARIVRLERGVPRYGEEISERYLVQETGVLQAVHFNKGCYLGQEIVERVRSRAQVHRHLTPIRIEGSEAPAAGTKLLADGNPVAEISSAVYSPRLGEVVGLAYVRTEAVEKKPEMKVDGMEPAIRAWVR